MAESPHKLQEPNLRAGVRRLSLFWRVLPLLIVLAMGAFDLSVYLIRGYQPETDDVAEGITKWTVSIAGFFLFLSAAGFFFYWTRPKSPNNIAG